MPYGKKPMKMVMGSKEKNTPMNFSEKAMKYMKAMPALYGKPRMDHGKPKMTEGDPIRKTRKGLTEKTANPNIDETGYKGTARFSVEARANRKKEKEYNKAFIAASKKVKSLNKKIDFIKENPGQREFNAAGVKESLKNAMADQKKFRNLMMKAHAGTKQAPKMYKNKKK